MGFPLFWRASTPEKRDEQGKVPPDSVASLETVKIGGTPQWILIRGRSTKNPIIVFLHGGPGMPCMYLAHEFQRPLEDDFVVVQWDRRGAGKTYKEDTPPELMRVTQEVADTKELVELIGSRFGQPKVYLVGHSYGSYLGMIVAHWYPELFHAYVGIGQVAHSEKRNREVQDRWIREQARARKNEDLLKQMKRGEGRKIAEVIAIGPPLMMRAVSELTMPYGVPTVASLNSIMVDATGMCGACMVPVTIDGKMVRKHACIDGPEIDAHIIDWDKFLPRFGQFKPQEQESRARRGLA